MEMPEGLKKLNEICGEGVKCPVAHEAVQLMKEMALALAPFAFEFECSETCLDTCHFKKAEEVFKKFKEWK